MRAFTSGLVGVLACAVSHSAIAAANEPTPEALQAQRQYVELTEMQLLDSRCHWLDATSRAALDATLAERKAWLSDQSAQLLVNPPGADAAKARSKSTPCDNPQIAHAIRYGSWQMRVTWLLRAHSLLPGTPQPAWFQAQSPVLAYRKSLDETLGALRSRYGADILQSQPGIQQQALRMLAAACPKAPHKCPTDAGSAPSKTLATVWVQQATQFARVLDRDPIKLPAPPEQTP